MARNSKRFFSSSAMRATRIIKNQLNDSVPSPALGSCYTIDCKIAISFWSIIIERWLCPLIRISSAVKLYDSVSVDSSILAKNLTKLNKDLVPKFEAGCDDAKRKVPRKCRKWILIKIIICDS